MVKVMIVRNSGDMARLLVDFQPGGGPFVVVPNWHCEARGYGTDAATLDYLLAALPGTKVVVEAYDGARTADGARFSGLSLEQAREHREFLRREDRRFLARTGIGEVLRRHDAEYLNVTEDVWEGRTAGADEVAELVAQRTHRAVTHGELCAMVPRRLWEMRQKATLIDCAKLKAVRFEGGIFFTLSMKNLFGLIPVPDRTAYHGADELGLSRTIVDMNQIYTSMFRTIAVCEAIHSAQISDTTGFNDACSLVEGLGLAACSDSTVELDAFIVHSLGVRPEDRHFLRMGAEVFGRWDDRAFPALPSEVVARLRPRFRSMGV